MLFGKFITGHLPGMPCDCTELLELTTELFELPTEGGGLGGLTINLIKKEVAALREAVELVVKGDPRRRVGLCVLLQISELLEQKLRLLLVGLLDGNKKIVDRLNVNVLVPGALERGVFVV